MSMSAARIRSMSNRSRFAEEAAFPGLRSDTRMGREALSSLSLTSVYTQTTSIRW
jgi:hypothetical protein